MSILTVASGQSVYRGYQYAKAKKVLHLDPLGKDMIKASVAGNGSLMIP